MSAAPIPITVLGGYLGAGKTTLVNRVLRESQGRRIGVVVNDFGELAIDVALIEAAAAQGGPAAGAGPIVNLANGCVCCTLGDDLRATMDALAAVEPRLDHILIETSGVADPAATAAWGTVPGFLPNGIIVLAAADGVIRLAGDRYVGGEVLRQLTGADLIALTRTDLVDAMEEERVRGWLAERVDAPIVVAGRDGLGTDVVLDVGLGVGGGRRHPAGLERAGHAAGVAYLRWSTEIDPVDEAQLAEFIERLPAGVLRAKGFVEVTVTGGGASGRLVQVVGRSVRITPWDVPARGALEVIGVGDVLDVSSLEDLANDYLRFR